MTDIEADDRLIAIATIWNRPELLTFVAMLDAHDIPVFISGEWHASVEPISVALGGHEVKVPVAFFEQATALNAALAAEPPIEGSARIRERIWALMVGITALLSVPAWMVGVFWITPFLPVTWPMTRGEYRTQ